MKNLNAYISEAIKITSKSKVVKYNYCPKDKKELEKIVKQLIEERGLEADLNDIDTSQIEDMSSLFAEIDYSLSNMPKRDKCFYQFNGDISGWDVSNVKNMECMFAFSAFNGKHVDISNWNVSKVKTMKLMFYSSKYDGNLSKWDVSKVENMNQMFKWSQFTSKNGSIDKWDVRNVKDMEYMFAYSSFNGCLDNWEVNTENVKMWNAFNYCPLDKNPPSWYKD